MDFYKSYPQKMNHELLAKLDRLYPQTVNPDPFSRRPALPSEVEQVIKKPIPKEEAADWDGRPLNTTGCDRGGHRERSQANDHGQHKRHWGGHG